MKNPKQMELKYKAKDVQTLIDVFVSLFEKHGHLENAVEEINKLTEYPLPVVAEFVKCIDKMDFKGEDYTKKNYWGIIGYICMRLNFADETKDYKFMEDF